MKAKQYKTATKATNRRPLYAKIHIARKQLGMSDEAYRGLLAERFGVESSSKLTAKQLVLLLKHFEDLGFVPTTKYAAAKDRKPLIKKVWALSYALDRPVPQYADALASRMYGIEKTVWLGPDQLKGLISALNIQKEKEAARG